LAYQPATALAEKFETIVSRGLANSRLRDYYDIWLLSTLHGYDGAEIAAAISATFAHRGTALPRETPPGLTAAFHGSAEAQARWRSFLASKGADAPSDLADVCGVIVDFVMPPAAAAVAGDSFSSRWNLSAGWS